MALRQLAVLVLSAAAVFVMTEGRSMGGVGSGPSGIAGAGFSLSDILQNEDSASSFLGGVASADPEQLELPFLTAGAEQLELFGNMQPDIFDGLAGRPIYDGRK